MIYKWLGAILVIGGCGGVGIKIAAAYKYEEKTMGQLVGILDYMSCELQYRLTPLPSLCRQASGSTKGVVSELFCNLAQELEEQISPDADCCMRSAIEKTKGLPECVTQHLLLLGNSLGKFDLEGQARGLETIRQLCRRKLEYYNLHRENRLRSYHTLALCAGAAIAILFV